MKFFVGIDDTDSSKGFCTTYLAYRIASDLLPEVRVLPYPRLVRLNPNIPFKTRGNAAVCLRVEAADSELAFELIASKVRQFSDVSGGANSGLVFVTDPPGTDVFAELYMEAIRGVISPHRVRKLLKQVKARSFELGNGMGIVGAASSIGFDPTADHSYELIAYRRKENWGTRRLVDESSVRSMDARTFPRTFNNYDYQKGKVLIAPHGPDPVFVGVRGDSPQSVIKAFRMVKFAEALEGHMVYETNQHTDAHLNKRLEWKVYSSGWLEGKIEGVRVGEGGHVYGSLSESGLTRVIAAYEPTGDLRRAFRKLRTGARVRVHGGVRRGTALHPEALNLEKLEVLSPGKGLPLGIYISSPRSNRHLTKPLIRYGRESRTGAEAVEGWLGRYTATSARRKSSMRSSGSSMPTETLTKFSGIPVFSLSLADI